MGNNSKNRNQQTAFISNMMDNRRRIIKNRLHNKFYELGKSNFETDLNYKQWDYVYRRFWSEGKVGAFKIPFIETSENDVLAHLDIGFAQLGGTEELDMYYNLDKVQFTNSKNFPVIPKGLQQVDKDCVVGYITGDRKGLYSHIEPLIDEMVDVDQIMYLNLLMQKSPALVALDDSKEYDKAQDLIYRILLNDEPVIFAEGINPGLFKAVNLGSEFIADKLTNVYNNLESQILTFLGINNSGTNKIEQVQLAEVNSNNEAINLGDDQFETELKGFCDRCKKVLGVEFYIRVKSPDTGMDGESHMLTEKTGPEDYLMEGEE